MDLDAETKRDFPRVARLLMQLPTEARVIFRINPVKDWSWDKEVQSQILRQLGFISDQISKMGSKKKPKAPEQLQPDYVEKGKEELRARRDEAARWTEEEKQALRDFWARKNGKI